jgi:hypothetical protein
MAPDTGRTLLFARLDEAEARLDRLARSPVSARLTEPDPGGEERWDAGQVWAHLAEFPTYWLGEAKRIVAAPAGETTSFGRGTDAAVRTEPIEAERHRPTTELWAECQAGIADVRAFAASASETDWTRLGDHVTKGPVAAGFVLEAFVGGHLLEHAAQLDGLDT